MYTKPLLALMNMCMDPRRYVGQGVDTDTRFDVTNISRSIKQFLTPPLVAATTGGSQRTLEAYLRLCMCQID